MQLSEAGKSDAQRIVKMAWEIWPEWYWPVIGPEQIAYMLENIYQPSQVEKQMDNGQRFFILSLRNQDAGFIGLNNGRLEKLYLHRQFRGRGFGQALLEKAEEETKKGNFNSIELNVNRFNPSLSFYLRHGFEIVRKEDIPFGPFFLNDFILRKKIQDNYTGKS